MHFIRCLLLVCVAACGDNKRKPDDGGIRDDAEGPPAPPVDAAPDANVVPTEVREIVPGTTRMTGATYTFDVQLGHPMQQHKATGPTYMIEGNAGVKP